MGGEAEVTHAVRGLGQLAQDASGTLERLVGVPERTGGAEPGELEFGGAVALGDVSGAVDAGEEDGDTLAPGALQRAEAMADLLDRGAETGGEKLEIVAQVLRRFQEGRIGQQQRPGEIV